jgi:hypothetical protein
MKASSVLRVCCALLDAAGVRATRVVRSNTPSSYVLNGRGHIVNKKGEVIQTAIKPGTRVPIYYANAGDSRTVDRVAVD